VPPCSSGTAASFEQVDRRGTMQHQNVKLAAVKSNGPPIGATMKSNHYGNPTTNNASGYAPPLNHILGGLHKDRLSRLSMNRPLSRGESSLHSMGSEGAHSGGGTSYRSLPGNLHAATGGFGAVNTLSWNMPVNVNQQQHQPPPPFVQQQKPLPMYEDAEMEEADTATNHHYDVGAAIAAAGSFNGSHAGSVASFHGSHAGGSFGNLSRASSSVSGAVGENSRNIADPTTAPKWKRRVNLPSHSSLY